MPKLSDAIIAIKAGRRDEARVMLTQLLAVDQRNVTALLWMTEVSQTPEERRKYLGRILEIDPNNPHARKGLDLLGKVDEKPSRIVTDPQPMTQKAPNSGNVSVVNPPNPIATQENTKKCPYCAEVIKADAIVCRFCHRDLTTPVIHAARYDPLNSIMPSSKDVTTPSVGLVVGIIIVALIIVGFLWADVGVRFMNMTIQVIMVYGGDPTQGRWLTLISFVFAIATWIAARFVTKRRSSTSDKLTLLATLGCIGAVLASGMVDNNSILIAIPLYVVAVYLFNTVKQGA